MKICVNCGILVKDKNGDNLDEVFDTKLYKNTAILKLLQCYKCNKTVDKYIEYEGCLLLLDLALQCPASFRHVLVNSHNNKLILKLVLMTLIIDGFIKWSVLHPNQEFHNQEYQFYTEIAISSLCLFCFLASALFILIGYQVYDSGLKTVLSNKVKISTILFGLLLAYCSRSLRLMALLWETDRSGFLWTFVDLLFFITSFTVIQAFSKLNTVQCITTAVIAHAVFISNLLYSQYIHNT